MQLLVLWGHVFCRAETGGCISQRLKYFYGKINQGHVVCCMGMVHILDNPLREVQPYHHSFLSSGDLYLKPVFSFMEQVQV